MISLIVAMDENGLIGNEGDIPWHIPKDFELFKNYTKNNIIIMGRRTWDSLPKKPLPHRINIVISRSINKLPGAEVFSSVENAINYCNENFKKDIFFLCFTTIYGEGIKYCDHMHISHVKGKFQGDTHFPNIDWNEWNSEYTEEYDKFKFILYQRIKS